MKNINKFLILILSLFLFTSCKCNQDVIDEGIAYGIVYNDYIGKASVKTVNNKISSITIDEAYLPSTWAKLKSASSVATDTIEISNIIYPAYIKIDNQVLKANIENANTENAKVTWTNTTINDLSEYLKTESNAKWYYEALQNKKAYPCDSAGKKLDLELLQTKYFKSEGGYWDKWSTNISALCEGMVKNNLKNEPTVTDDSKIKFGDVVTSATLIGYQDYYNLAKKAYNKIPKDTSENK